MAGVADVTRLRAHMLELSLKSQYATRPVAPAGPQVFMSVWICAWLRTLFHNRTSSMSPSNGWLEAAVVDASAQAPMPTMSVAVPRAAV